VEKIISLCLAFGQILSPEPVLLATFCEDDTSPFFLYLKFFFGILFWYVLYCTGEGGGVVGLIPWKKMQGGAGGKQALNVCLVGGGTEIRSTHARDF
jgi:hypothetical protein